jgi:DNA-directed RNA polymerase subunit alpha
VAVNAKNWQEMKKPNGLEKKTGGDSKRKATFVAEPLERGFGLTLGNSLRRVLLSSLQGAAVTSIKIENVLHEFSSLAGVREDVTDIVLNVKQIALRMQGEGPKRLQLSVTGPAEVTAGDIATSGDIEVMNPDLVICHLDEGATLNMELTADIGKGYVPSANNRPVDAPIGLIPVDALYSPVRQVAYKVENTRVGQELDYDKLTITVETDGTVTPDDALAYSARILQDQLQLFVHFDEGLAPASAPVGMPAAPSASETESDANQLNRYRAFGAFGQLPQERQHHLYRRSRAEDRGGDAADAEFRSQVAQRDQGSAVLDGAAAGHGDPRLAAREYRGNGQEARTGILSHTAVIRRKPGRRCDRN